MLIGVLLSPETKDAEEALGNSIHTCQPRYFDYGGPEDYPAEMGGGPFRIVKELADTPSIYGLILPDGSYHDIEHLSEDRCPWYENNPKRTDDETDEAYETRWEAFLAENAAMWTEKLKVALAAHPDHLLGLCDVHV